MRPFPQGAALSWPVASLLVTAFVATFSHPAPAAVLVVDPQTGPYTTIQQALEAAQPADTIEIHSGVHDEELSPHGSTPWGPWELPVVTLLCWSRAARSHGPPMESALPGRSRSILG
jgi:hypothetical protein